ncbi:glycoside hydrolase family 93 protein [Curvularia clavata]|uniref:Glycoside hydrolase family 93 protein n=1 Tax=Curvularia clavata TaxID=95742 RepID=A0A9Q8ZCW7_CURCL|nr:glycoside hydrolase family 93 protein [Curvularia clavata]
MAPTRSSNKEVKKQRGRPPGRRNPNAGSKPVSKPGIVKKAKARKKQPPQEAEDELSITEATLAQSSKPRKRKSDDGAAAAELESKSRKEYLRLEAKAKRVTRDQVDKWPEVSSQVLDQILTVVRNAKKDTAETQRDERKVMAAYNTLNPLVRKLARQLADSRIPPQAKDVHFNIDKLTERNAEVSREVTTARHSKQLLSEQIKIAEHLLKKDEEYLELMKKNTKTWRTEWKHQRKHGRVHPLLQPDNKTAINGDFPEDIGLKRSEQADLSSLDSPDDQLSPVLEQLRRSLKNMQSNHTQLEGLGTAIGNAQAALDDVLFRHANAAQYANF